MKFDASAFLYMEPDSRSFGSPKEFAQCATCTFWIKNTEQCSLHSPRIRATWDTTCGLYVNGPQHEKKTLNLVTPQESGAERRQVRCENCALYKVHGSTCLLFKWLNKAADGVAKIRERVNKYGCCNANISR